MTFQCIVAVLNPCKRKWTKLAPLAKFIALRPEQFSYFDMLLSVNYAHKITCLQDVHCCRRLRIVSLRKLGALCTTDTVTHSQRISPININKAFAYIH